MINGKRVAVVMPAYNAELTLEATVREIPDLVDIRILVDDYSKDKTVELAKKLGLLVFVHDRNYGYGRNQQTCYREALAAGADVVIMVHPDYQYTPLLITAMASMVAYDVYDVVLGSRIIGGQALRGGMPLYKYISNRFLTAFENLFLGVKLSEYHTGYRAFSSKVLTTLPLDGELRRLRLRQPDAGAVRAFRLPHRRGLLPDEVFRGSVVYQLPAQREVRIRRARHLTPVQDEQVGHDEPAALQRPGPETRIGGSRSLAHGAGHGTLKRSCRASARSFLQLSSTPIRITIRRSLPACVQ